MFIQFLLVLIWLIGLLITAVGHGNPLLHYFYFDILGVIICVIPIMITFVRLRSGGCWNNFSLPTKNKPLYDFLYRIGKISSVFGKRIPGTGFSQVKGLGVIQEIGRLPSPGSVYNRGDKATQFVLQDLAHTPNPKFAGFTTFLTTIGFNNIQEVNRVLNGYDPELMVEIWSNLNEYEMKDTSDVLVERLQNLTIKDMKKYPKNFSNNKEMETWFEKQEK